MLKVRISGVPGLDGEYPLNMDMTNADYRLVKKMSGLRAGEFDDAFDAGDTDLTTALTAVALTQNGVAFHHDQLWHARPSAFDVVTEQDADASPPAPATSGGASSGTNVSGSSLSNGSESSPVTSTPPTSGPPASASTPVVSDPVTSAS